MASHPLHPDDPHDPTDLDRLAVLVATWRVEGGSAEHVVAAACELVVDGCVDPGVVELAGAPGDATADDLREVLDDVLLEVGAVALDGESPFDHALRLVARSVVTGGHTPEFLTLWQHRWGSPHDERLVPLVLAERWYAALDQDPDGLGAAIDRAELEAAVRVEAASLAARAPSRGVMARLDAAVRGE